jgi:hypothetical protein
MKASPRTRGYVALLGALAVHAAVVTVAVRTARPSPPPRERAPELVDVAVLEEGVSADRAPERGAIAERGLPSPAGAVAGSSERSGVARAATPSAPSAAAASEEVIALDHASPDRAPEGWTFNPTTVDLGVDSRGRSTAAGRVGSMGATEGAFPDGPPKVSETGGLVEGLHARDQAMGLGRGGPVRSAVESVVQAANTMGVATFEVRIGGSGTVSVHMVEASGDPNWIKLADAISAEVKANRDRIRLPPNAKGLRVTVRAEAKDRWPDGRPPPKKANTIVATPGKVHETKDRIDIELPKVEIAHEGKVCSAKLVVGLQLPDIQGGCSLENIGSTPVRIVAATIISESFL